MKIVSIGEMRQIEQATDARGQSYPAMMEMAGGAVANMAEVMGLARPEAHVLILVGPGNNGGDGLVAARYLREHDHEITLYIWRRDVKGDENLRKLKQRRRGLTILWADNDAGFTKLREEVARADLIIDALLGTGATRRIEGQLADLLTTVREEVNACRLAEVSAAAEPPLGIPRFPLMEALTVGLPPPSPAAADDEDLFAEDFDEDLDEEEALDEDDAEAWEEEPDDLLPPAPWPPLPILAVDCPSGLNCDTGALDPAALRASVTVTFAYPKWGQVQYPGADACGLLCVADIGVPPDLDADLPVSLVGPADVAEWLPLRPADAHKGTFGKALIAAGSLSYTGAAALSAGAATRAGAGLVTLAIPAALHTALAGALPEVTWLPLPEAEGVHTAAGAARLLARLAGYDALLVGPGLTATDEALGFIEALFSREGGLDRAQWSGRIVVDADALNLLARLPAWPGRLPPLSILTPHPGEMARLTGLAAAEVNARRIENARRWAAEWGHVVLLKGPHTVIAAPDGRTAVLPFALPALATAGSGDVLAGAIVALLAQGLAPFEAAAAGAYLHGQAGLVLSRVAPAGGGVAGDILARFPEALRQVRGTK